MWATRWQQRMRAFPRVCARTWISHNRPRRSVAIEPQLLLHSWDPMFVFVNTETYICRDLKFANKQTALKDMSAVVATASPSSGNADAISHLSRGTCSGKRDYASNYNFGHYAIKVI